MVGAITNISIITCVSSVCDESRAAGDSSARIDTGSAGDTGAPATDRTLLAVDLGLRTGLACYARDGRLKWFRSRNYGTRSRLKKAAWSVMKEADPVDTLVIEGGGELAPPWTKEAERRDARLVQIGAERWRRELLLTREQRSGADAKKHAMDAAYAVIDWSGLRRPSSLRHDAAEAILIGLWGVRRLGWTEGPTL